MSKDNATHFCARSGDSYCWDEFLGYGVWYEKLGEWVRSMFTQDEIEPYLTKLLSKKMNSNKLADEIMKKSKESVYTQEMKDNSEVPVVGMMVLSRGEALEVISVYHIADAKVLTLFNSKTSGVRALYFKTAEVINIDVIDQHTDSEKAIDDLVLQINRVQYDANMSDMALKDIIAVAFEAGISFTGDKK